MDPTALVATLASGTPEQQAMAVDGALIVVLPLLVRYLVAPLEWRPPRRAKTDGPLRRRWLAARWLVYRHRARVVKGIPMALALFVTVARALVGAALGLDPVTEGARGFGAAIGAVGLRELGRSPGRVASASPDGAPEDGAGR